MPKSLLFLMYKTLGLGGFIVTVVALLKGHAPSNGLHINYTIWYCSGHTCHVLLSNSSVETVYTPYNH